MPVLKGHRARLVGVLRRCTYTSPPTHALHPSLARLPRFMSTNTNTAFVRTYTFPPSPHKIHPSRACTPCQVLTPTPHRAHARRSRVRRTYIFPRTQKHTESGTLACCPSRPRTSFMGPTNNTHAHAYRPLRGRKLCLRTNANGSVRERNEVTTHFIARTYPSKGIHPTRV